MSALNFTPDQLDLLVRALDGRSVELTAALDQAYKKNDEFWKSQIRLEFIEMKSVRDKIAVAVGENIMNGVK